MWLPYYERKKDLIFKNTKKIYTNSWDVCTICLKVSRVNIDVYCEGLSPSNKRNRCKTSTSKHVIKIDVCYSSVFKLSISTIPSVWWRSMFIICFHISLLRKGFLQENENSFYCCCQCYELWTFYEYLLWNLAFFVSHQKTWNKLMRAHVQKFTIRHTTKLT